MGADRAGGRRGWHPDPIERLPEYVGRAAEIMREHGEREPLWMAETGSSSVGGRAANAWGGVRVEGGGGERAVVLSLRGDEVLLARVAP